MLIERFDHAVVAVRDLDAAIARFGALGFEVHAGGRHGRFGTHNATFRFGLDYVELIAVFDEGLALAAGPGRVALVEFLRHGEGLVGFALASPDLDGLAERFRATGLAAVGPSAMERRRPDGTLLTWRLLTPGGVSWRKPWPFFIQWDLADAPRLEIERPGEHANGARAVSGVAVAVRDLDAACDLYGRQLGLDVAGGLERADLAARRAVARIGTVSIELLAAAGAGAVRETLAGDGEGPLELVLRSADLGRTGAFLDSAGVPYAVGEDGRLALSPAAASGVSLVFAR